MGRPRRSAPLASFTRQTSPSPVPLSCFLGTTASPSLRYIAHLEPPASHTPCIDGVCPACPSFACALEQFTLSSRSCREKGRASMSEVGSWCGGFYFIDKYVKIT